MPAMTAQSERLELAGEFPPASRAQWQGLVGAVLGKSGIETLAEPELALAGTTYDGISLAPLYTAEDSSADPGLPGRPPHVRGRTLDGLSALGWDVRQRHADPDAVAANREVLADLFNGVTSLWLGVGAGAIAVADLGRVLDGVHLDLTPIALDAGPETVAASHALLDLAAAAGVSAAELSGTLGADPIGARARTGTAADLGVLGVLAGELADYPNLRAVTVDATVYHDAGGSDSDELAIAASTGVAYLGALVDSGLGVEQALARLEFRYAVGADQFASIAKLRAARRVWDRIAELSGAAPQARGQRQHASTSAAMMTRRDPWVNLLRTTIACFAAAIGGAEVISVAPFDAAIGRSDAFARRIARNTHSILHDEASLARVTDAAGGSWYVESRTEQLAELAWAKFRALEGSGGALAALEDGAIATLLGQTRQQRAHNIATRQDPITGVSEFADVAEQPVQRPPSAPPVAGLLPTIRYAEQFEALRDRSDAHLVRTGSRPTVFLAALGPVGAHSARLAFAGNLFQAAGIEVVAGLGEPGELAAALTAAGLSVACLCSSDKVYADAAVGAAPSAKALKDAGVRLLWLAGQPGPRQPAEVAAGVDGFVFAGCDAIEALTETLAALEVQ